MNLAQNLTQHIADPENIIIIDGTLPDNAWITAHTPYMASNVLPSPTIPTYYIIDLSLISNQFDILINWLTTNNSLISFADSYWFIALGHELKNSTYEAQIENAIASNLFFSIHGQDMANMIQDFNKKGYPFYYQVAINNNEIPDGLSVIDKYAGESRIFSVELIKSIFALYEVSPMQRQNLKFVFTKVTNERDESTVAFKVSIDNKVGYYDFSGGHGFDILNVQKSRAAAIK